MRFLNFSLSTLLFLTCLPLNSLLADSLPRCLYVSSYHSGYAWSDGVEKGLRQTLAGRCELEQFNLDTKRVKDPEQIEKKITTVRRLIEHAKPDVVITADDNAAKYLIQPYYIDSDIPFVFCGINWSAENYGFPASNITGMIEVAPIKPLMEWAQRLTLPARMATYIGADTLTEQKNYERYKVLGERMGISVIPRFASTSAEWRQHYIDAQEYDFVILGSNAGINDWQNHALAHELPKYTRRLSITVHKWMMPYSAIGFTKLPEEQGIWAGQTALAIIEQNIKPIDIPIVANRQWDIWINSQLITAMGINLPAQLEQKAKFHGQD
jgi:ABC-type uncharacterized transport system substrate-binding protein